MAVDPNACIFCELVHKGPCGGAPPKQKAARKATKKAVASSDVVVDTPEKPDPFENALPTAQDRWGATGGATVDPEQAALNALAGIMHDTELSKRGMRRPSQPQIAARAAAWKAGRHGSR